jgi:enoyl-CoA hydratase
MAEPVLRDKDGDVTIITLNRPDVGNRQSDEVWAQVTEMFNAASKDSRAVVFKGAGDDFCLGRAAMGQPTAVLEAYAVRERADTIFNLYGAFRNCKAPIIGVVQGRAAGLGCALAALCDITIASDKAKFSFPEMAHRIMPTIAFSALVDRLSRKGATYMIYSTEESTRHGARLRARQQRRASGRIGRERCQAGRAVQENPAARAPRRERIRQNRFRHGPPSRHRLCAQPARDGE